MTTTVSECGRCGHNLTTEEIECPACDHRGEPLPETICDECYHEHYEFTCCRCENYEYVEFQHVWLVVFEETDGQRGPVTPGIYEVIDYPYYTSGMIGGGWLHESSLRRTPGVVDFSDDGYPCGHLCRACARRLRLRESKAGKALRRARA